MQKSNKKINPPRRTKIKELTRRGRFFKGGAGSNTLDFFSANI
jgi:hypothetical protein